jgi:hypothetical protein
MFAWRRWTGRKKTMEALGPTAEFLGRGNKERRVITHER